MLDFLAGGDFNKFTVFKNEDMEKYLPWRRRFHIQEIRDFINTKRLRDNKPVNTYIVINADEEYAPEIIEILKAHGHWGDVPAEKQIDVEQPNVNPAPLADEKVTVKVVSPNKPNKK